MSKPRLSSRPERVKVAGVRYTVQYIVGPPLVGDEIGEHDAERQLLTVKNGLPLEREQLTVLHECLHAISDAGGLGLTERQVDGLESALFAFFRDNRGAMAYLRRRK